MNTGISATKLRVKKQKTVILQDINFEIAAGTVTGLIGPSGSGKTTLMRALVGVQKYTGGLEVIGVPAGSTSLRKRIGYVTQTPAVYGDLTVKQNLDYFATLTQADRSRVEAVIKQVGLSKQHKQLVASLSGGQRARVSLAVALMGNPDVLILDEPTVGVDPILRDEIWNLFHSLAKQGKTLLISSHVMDEAEKCDELLLMRDGKILWNDSKDSLLEKTKQSRVGDAFVAMIGDKK